LRSKKVANVATCLLRDRDAIFGEEFRRQVTDMGIHEVVSAPRAPWQRAYVERVIGSSHCPQVGSVFGVASESEDCLYLNVFTPNDEATEENRRHGSPVLVWIHGGALTVGESDDYIPTKLVFHGRVIVVTINYRLGALGFLAHPALSAESPDPDACSFALESRKRPSTDEVLNGLQKRQNDFKSVHQSFPFAS